MLDPTVTLRQMWKLGSAHRLDASAIHKFVEIRLFSFLPLMAMDRPITQLCMSAGRPLPVDSRT
jgi:hypothetical protein